MNINGVIYHRITDSEGVATLDINLIPGEYIITSMYDGCFLSNTITVLSTIESENIEMIDKERIPFNVRILNGVGKPLSGDNVSFNLNGLIYNKTTNTEGITGVNLYLNPGEYIITTIFNDLFKSNKIRIL